MFQSHLIKSAHRVLRKDEVDTYRAPVFASDYSATVFAMYIRFLWSRHYFDFEPFVRVLQV